MKIDIYVFSGTNNTLIVANLFKSEFLSLNCNCNIKQIENGFDVDYSCDIIGIFYPIHAFNAPLIVEKFVKSLKKCSKKVFIVKTSGEYLKLNNISDIKISKILKKKKYDLFSIYHYIMPYNIIFYHGKNIANQMYEIANKRVKKESIEIINFKRVSLEKVPFGTILRFLFSIEHIGVKFNGLFFKVNLNKCIKCKMCVNKCPNKNIIFKNGKFHFKNNCMLCGRCYFYCIKDAISIGLLNKWKVNKTSPKKVKEIDDIKFLNKSYQTYFTKYGKDNYE